MAGSGEVYNSLFLKPHKPLWRAYNDWGKSWWHYPNRYKDGPRLMYNGRSIHAPSPGLSKWWTKHHPLNGLVTENLSPYQTRPVYTLFRDFFSKLKTKPDWDRIRARTLFHLYFSIGICVWAQNNWEFKHRMHWE